MGKKVRGAALRAKKRAKTAQLELVDETAHHVATGHVTSKTDDQLFMLDTTAAPVPKEQQVVKSKKDQVIKRPRVVDEKVQALLSKHDAATLQKIATTKPKKRKATPAFDLWQDEDNEDSTSSQVKRAAGIAPPHLKTKAARAAAPTKSTVAVDVAQSGQSYLPDPHQHQNVIGEALALELRRKEEEEYRQAPLAAGMRDETRALLMGDDDDESSSDEDEDEDTVPVVLHKQKQKLTRAQRNRQKRIRAGEKQAQQRKLEKKRLNAISQAKVVSNQLKKQEAQQKERKAQLQSLKQQQARTPGTSVVQHVSEKNPLHAPTLPVALTDEISGALRTMKPKGSLLTDRMESFRDRNMATAKNVGDRKRIVQGNKRRKLKIKAKGHADIHVKDKETGKDYLLMG